MLSFALALTLTAAPEANAGYGFCSNVDWSDLVAYAPGTFLEGGIRSQGIGGKGYITATDEVVFDAYDNSTWVGSADVDASGTVTLSGDVTGFEPMAVGWDCNVPSALRYFIKAQADGSTYYVIIYP